ncbi:hypothetical protein HZB93_00845 [Candidatus Falkowbacteria bacterium]|nr:hypothetical protein [Candidatus Falkowbacteria bacterium]
MERGFGIEKQSEEFPFQAGDRVSVKNNETGRVENWWLFTGWDEKPGKAVVQNLEGFIKKVDRDTLLTPQKEKE